MTVAADYIIPERHDAVLRNMLNLEIGPELPIELKEAYLLRKRLADRVSFQLTDSDLTSIAIDYGVGLPGEERQDFFDIIKENTVPLGTNVLVKWRFGKEVAGKYQGTKGAKVLVLLDDESGQIRNCDPEKVRLAE